MKLWFSVIIAAIGLACYEADSSSSKRKCGINVYSKEWREKSTKNKLDPDLNSIPDSGQISDSDEDCNIHKSLYLESSMNNRNNPNGYTDCPPSQPIYCDPRYPYRTMNGTCNNLQNPLWGAATQCFLRHVPAFYEAFFLISGLNNSRRSITGAPLPNPRTLSVNIFQNRNHPTEDLSFMFTIYGQSIAHDISLSDFAFPANPGDCCAPANANDPACWPVRVPPNDPFYSQFGVTCLNLYRTEACNACDTNKRQQITGQTAPMDLSIIYAPQDDIANLIRANDGTGRLLSNYTETGEFLPSGNLPDDLFCPMLQRYQCFNSGDPRTNQHVALTSIQTLFMREHNRIAIELKKLNPRWNEERLYQEARRITIAEIQHINYYEYLPNLLGDYYMTQFGLYEQRGSGGTRYNPSVRLGAWNEFSTVAYRLHSMVATNVGALNLQFRNLYSNPPLIWEGYMGQILNGMCAVPSEKQDRWFVDDVTDFLFQTTLPYGNDLASLDMQRGRDHGIAPYVYYIYLCSDGNVNIQSFEDLSYNGIISREDAATLRRNYATVQDVDLYVGLHMEYYSRGAKLGPTSACIVARQFYQLKYGDRFYFEHIGEAGSFTAAQRASIKLTSLSRMLCDNTQISNVQFNSLLLPSRSNPQVGCYDIAGLDLSLWKE